MHTLLQITPIHAEAQKRLERDYTIIAATLGEIDDAWLAAHADKVEAACCMEVACGGAGRGDVRSSALT